ncbi:MAG: hypothetical protein ACOCRX_05645 [Candidatus Woesearchaeota archaeon]
MLVNFKVRKKDWENFKIVIEKLGTDRSKFLRMIVKAIAEEVREEKPETAKNIFKEVL